MHITAYFKDFYILNAYLEVFKEKLGFNLDLYWLILEKYTFFKIKFQFLKILLDCFLFDQQYFLTI
jgi:hypothetical protein